MKTKPLSSLAERLSVARSRRFVGRKPECELFQSALSAPELPFSVLYVFGPGGIGKTTLLREFCRICQSAQVQAVYLDCRNIEPIPESFLCTLRVALGLPETSAWQHGVPVGRWVLMLDTYELLVALDQWLRDVFLPQLSEHTLIVLAGRQPPTSAWRADLGWQTVLQPLSLRNLSPEESKAYLLQSDLPDSTYPSVLSFTHGHPLALSLIAEVFAQGRDVQVQPVAPDIVKALLERFLEEVPSPLHRMALEGCAIARLTTEPLLATLLNLPDMRETDVHELFTWLQNLSFIEFGAIGLFPHDLAREVLISELRWRNPDWYVELHQRARSYYMHRLAQVRQQERHAILFDYTFLHRDHPAIKPRFTWQEKSSLFTDALRTADRDVLMEIVTKHEGELSAHLHRYWLEKQPAELTVFRNSQQQVMGFVQMVALHRAQLVDLEVDPAAIACWHYLQQSAPLRQGEGATLFRFWMASDTYQDVSPVQSLIFIHLMQYYQSTPGLAFTFLPCAHPEFWADLFAYADLTRLPQADFETDGRRYGVYGHDWRVISPATWQELLAQREVTASAIPPVQDHEPTLVLSHEEFIEAVHQALRQFLQPSALLHNPLLRSRLVIDHAATQADPSDRLTTLQTLIRQVAESLQMSPRDDKFYQVLYRTYFQPAATQELAAAALDLPFSTYRRHLKAGMARVADILWQREIS